MIHARLSIGRLMVLVALIGLNAGVARALYDKNPEVLFGGALCAIALQGAVVGVLRLRGPARGFWLGFLIFGGLAIGSFLWAEMFPEVLGLSREGILHIQAGSPPYYLWMGYGEAVFERLRPFLFEPQNENDPRILVVRALVWATPQLLCALLGGVLFWTVYRVFARKDASRPPDPGDPTRDLT